MGQPSSNAIESGKRSELPSIVNELKRFYVADLNANVGCFKAILKVTPPLIFSTSNETGESSRQTLERFISSNFSFLSEILPDQKPRDNIQYILLENLIENYKEDAEQVSDEFEKNPDFFQKTFSDPLWQTQISGFNFFLSADGELARQTGTLLKHIDAVRSQGFPVERPQELNSVWGPEGAKPNIPSPETNISTATSTSNLLSQPDYVTLGDLRQQIPLLDNKMPGIYISGTEELPTFPNEQIETLCHYTVGSALQNHFAYEKLANFRREENSEEEIFKPIGNGSSPADDLRHEVTNLFKRIQVIRKDDSQLPLESDFAQLDINNLLNLYLKGAYILVNEFTDPSKVTEKFDWWGPKTGSELLLSAYRHFELHGGTLNAHYRARKDFLY